MTDAAPTRTTSHDPRTTGLRPWAEMNVRPWVVLAALVLVAVGALFASNVSAVRAERRLINEGVVTQAKVIQIAMATELRSPRDEAKRVTLQYVDPKGRTQEAAGTLPRKKGASVAINDVLTVRVDRDTPTRWTERTEPPSLLIELLVPLLLTPAVLVCLLGALWQYRRTVTAVRTGERQTGAVASVKQSSLAPLSKQVGVGLEGPDRRVRYCYWPGKFGPVHVGDKIDLLVGKNGVIVPARGYVSP